MSQPAEDEIRQLITVAVGKFEFRRNYADQVLVRISSEGTTERLVRGWWVKCLRPRNLDVESRWQRMDEDQLYIHLQRYFIDNLDGPTAGWKGRMRQRARRSAFWRWVVPPPKGGGVLGVKTIPAVNRSRRSLRAAVKGVTGQDLQELKGEAFRGLEYQQNRSAAVEQRSSFFLGAAGLSTSLVLANASVLLGTGKLQSPWLALSAIALGLASTCAAVTGLRAVQATMFEFSRVPPHSALKRRMVSGDDLVQSYIAQLLVAELRERAIADWKGARLASARRWFLGTLSGVTLLTIFVLIEVL